MERAVEGVMTRDAVRQFETEILSEPSFTAFAEDLHVVVTVRPADGGAERDDEDVVELVQLVRSLTAVVEDGEAFGRLRRSDE